MDRVVGMPPATDLLARLDDQVIELDTTDPAAGLDDLRPLTDAFEGKQIVGMGEATHGTREFFQLKHRLLRFLVERLDFRIFGLEANFSETLAINDYVQRGEGDPEAALEGIYLWPWYTEEVLALIEWLREYNDGRDPGDQVRFYGYDAQYTAGPAEALQDYLRAVDPDFLDAKHEGLAMLADEGLNVDGEDFDEDEDAILDRRLATARDLISALDERFSEHRTVYAEETSEAELELASRHLRTLEQAIELNAIRARDGGNSEWTRTRDEHMAENVSWILDHESFDRIALWAHNEHVKTGEAEAHWGSALTMGEFLRREFGDQYYALGFEFGSGSLQAYPDADDGNYELEAFTVEAPFDGSLPATLRELDCPLCFLDFESAAEDPRVRQWLEREHDMHSLGALFYADDEKNRCHYVPADDFDGLLYVDETTRAVPLEGES